MRGANAIHGRCDFGLPVTAARSHVPLRISQTRPFAAGLVDEMRRMALDTRAVPDDEFFTAPTDMVFMNRLQFGFYSVLARLDVPVDYRAVEREFEREFAG